MKETKQISQSHSWLWLYKLLLLCFPLLFLSPRRGRVVRHGRNRRVFLGSLFLIIVSHLNSDGLRFKSQRKLSNGSARVRVRVRAVATTPGVSQAVSSGKQTLRKGTVVITGASSGLGLATARALADTGKWHVIMACRDFLKAERAAKSAGIDRENYTVVHLDLASLDSVRQFVENFRQSGRPLDVLVCNAAVYLPTAKEPTFTADGFELSVGTNHLGHFLLARLMLDLMKLSDYP